MPRPVRAALVCFIAFWYPASQAAGLDSYDEAGGNFDAPSTYAVGVLPYAATMADFNGDGLPDLAVGNEESDDVAVLLGAVGGTFGAAGFYPAGDGAQGVAVGDLDGNGTADFVVANLWDSTLSIRLGAGDGTFGAPQSRAVGANPHTLLLADFNSDGDVDIATANGSTGTSVLLNLGNGAFGTPTEYSAGINPRDIAAGDFDRDGDLDLAISNEGGANVSILRGNGNGTFGAATNFAVGAQPQSVSAGDLNGDNKLDLAVPSASTNTISLLLGNGNGGFSSGSAVPTAGGPTSARLVDLDLDGHLDLLVSGSFDRIFVHRGNGAGQFAPGSVFPAIGGARAPLVADLDGDARQDVIVVGSQAGAIATLRNLSQPPLNIARSSAARAGTSYARRKSELWINRQTSKTYPAGYPFSHVGYADIDKDGDTDYLRTFSNNQDLYPVQIMRNTGPGQFSDATSTAIVGAQAGVLTTRKVISGDYDSDGWPDFFVLGHGIDAPPFPGEPPRLFLSNGNGTLSDTDNPLFQAGSGFNHAGASADIDGNGTIDILVGRTGAPYLLLNDGSAQFELNTVRLPPGISFISSEFADIDQDGYIDLMVDGYEPNGDHTRIYWGGSNGLYRAGTSFTIPPVPDWGVILDFAIEDFDDDGRSDLVVLRTGSTNIYEGRYLQFLRNTSDRTYVDETAERIPMNRDLLPFDFLRAQDFDADGDIDLFIDDRNDVASGEYAWANDGAGYFSPYSGTVTPRVNSAAVEPGHSGVFFNPARNGEGNYVEVLNDATAVVYTFTYRPDGSGPAWFIGVGEIAGDTIEIFDLLRPTGTEFGDGFASAEIDYAAAGRMSMRFPDCRSLGNGGTVVYSGNPATGHEELRSRAKRLGQVTGCGQTASSDAGLSGSYYDKSRNGEGIVVEWLTTGEVLVVFFTYDLAGNQFWALGIGDPEDRSVTMEALYPASSTGWGSAFDAEEVQLATWGTFTLTWTACDAVTFEYDSVVPGFGTAQRSYTRLTRLAGTTCPAFP